MSTTFDVEYLSHADACKFLTVSKSGLNRLVRAGRLAKHKLGRRAIFALADLRRLLAERRTKTD
jgi:excisionase family DNA binding protein